MAKIDESVNKNNIDPTAQILGQSFITGKDTRIGAGAIIKDSYVENSVVEEEAKITDSVLITTGETGPLEKGKDFFEDREKNKNSQTKIGKKSEVTSATFNNSTVGPESKCDTADFIWSVMDEHSMVKNAYVAGLRAGDHVNIKGPTEVGGWLGHHAVLDKNGFFSGIFPNEFYVLEYDKETKSMLVKEIIDIPHVSRYGMNTICSGNSGKLKEQPENKMKTFGSHVGTWHQHLLSIEYYVLSPVCWVGGWTKVIGKSPDFPTNEKDMINDVLFTNLLPFSSTGVDGDATMAQTFPGEKNDAYSHKHRTPAWTFTYAPGAVFDMVKRVYDITKDAKIADNLVMHSLKNALALTYFYASNRNFDLDTAKGTKGWKGWLINSKEVLNKHINSGLWEFKNGEPIGWIKKQDKWEPKNPEVLLDIAPDALENQKNEEDLIKCDMETLDKTLGVKTEELTDTLKETSISDEAKVSDKAIIGPGVQIKGKSVIEDGVKLYRTIVDNSTIKKDSKVTRSVVINSQTGINANIVSSAVINSSFGDNSNLECARMENSKVAENLLMSAYGELNSVSAEKSCRIGSSVSNATVKSNLMSMHMAGTVNNIEVLSSTVEVNGKKEEVFPVPMLGGGLRVLGETNKKVTIEGPFIGSNTILEAGAHVGFGCFVLGRVQENEGLLPFTVSTAAGPVRDQIGSVTSQLASLVVTHLIEWAYQANGPEKADAVGQLIISKLKEGRDAILWGMEQRKANKWDENSPFAKFKSMKLYTDAQLESGLKAYEKELSDNRWEAKYIDGELRFTGNGSWMEKEGALRWEAN